jgi:hypothetical protein
MKKETLVTMSAISLVVLAAIGGMAFHSFAASSTAANSTSSDTDATSADKTFFGRHWGGRPLTATEQTQRDARSADAQTKFEAVQKALTANDYNAWVAAIKAINPDAPILGKINSTNFSKFAEAHTDIRNARAILEDLGVDGPGYGIGMGQGFGRGGMMGGFGRGMMGRWFR